MAFLLGLPALTLGAHHVVSAAAPHTLTPVYETLDNGTNATLNATNSTLDAAVPVPPVQMKLSPQANFSPFRPSCRTDMRGGCYRNGTASGSPTYACGRTAGWLDRGLVVHLVAELGNRSIVEFGAGEGCYTAAIHDQPAAIPVSIVMAYDHRAELAGTTVGLVTFAKAFEGPEKGYNMVNVSCADYVLSLEDLHHTEPAKLRNYLDSVDMHNSKGVILSWPAGPNSYHAFDEDGPYVVPRTDGASYARFNEVVNKMHSRGYVLNKVGTDELRLAASSLPWLGDSLYRFERKEPQYTCPKEMRLRREEA